MTIPEYMACAFFSVMAIAMTIAYWPRTGLELFHHRYAMWQASCRKRGLSQEGMQQEYLFRNAKVRLRRRASDAALHHPENYQRIIAEIAAEEAEALACHGKPLAKRFLDVVNKSEVSDILYEDALHVVMGKLGGAHATITADNLAALKTL